MSNFINYKKEFQNNFEKIVKDKNKIFMVDLNRDLIFEKYLQGFEDQDKQEYTCNCCKSFLRQYGGLVIINNDLSRTSLWDFTTEDPNFNRVNYILNEYINSLPIDDIFFNTTKKLGTDRSVDNTVVWDHLYLLAPTFVVKLKDSIPTLKGSYKSSVEVFKNSLSLISTSSVTSILTCIEENTLYRGKEFETILKNFLVLKNKYEKLSSVDKELFIWKDLDFSISRIKNSAIGTLLLNVSEGMELETAIKKYEKIVASTNYKRPEPKVTQKKIDELKKVIEELGVKDSLDRRYAKLVDLDVNNLLYSYRSSPIKDVFEEMSENVLVNPNSFSKLEKMTMEDFIKNVLPTAENVEILLENKHLNNLVSLITEVTPSPNILKWNNPFSWSYTGGVTDSIIERVKAAGGSVVGDLRISLSWNNYDDLDIHLNEPDGNEIYFGNKYSPKSEGRLDVDANAGGRNTRQPVENIIFKNSKKIQKGNYKVRLDNFASREKTNQGWVIQIEYKGEIFEFSSNSNKATSLLITEFSITDKGIIFSEEKKSVTSSITKWNLATNQFHKVNTIMFSPNHWNDNIGNKHFMFLIDSCVSDELARPFYNEFLRNEFSVLKNATEMLGNKLSFSDDKQQLSGLGFSETIPNEIIIKTKNKTIKVCTNKL